MHNFNMDRKLKITTFNCQGFKDRMYDYVNEVFRQCDLLLLQETWLYKFEHSNFNKIILIANSMPYQVWMKLRFNVEGAPLEGVPSYGKEI